MSQSTNPFERERLLQAKAFIEQKRYTEARTALEPIHTNPVAQKWLAKLDEIAPHPQAQADEFIFPSSPQTSHEFHFPSQADKRSTPTITPSPQRRRIEDLLNQQSIPQSIIPNHPTSLGSSSTYFWIAFFTGGFVALLFTYELWLAWNWHSFEKSRWAWTSIFLTLLAEAAGLGLLIVAVAIVGAEFTAQLGKPLQYMLTVGSITTGAGLNLGVMALQFYVQRDAYNAWIGSRRSSSFLRDYRYNFDGGSLIAVIIVVAALLGGMGLGYALVPQPKSYETAYFSVTTQDSWTQLDPNSTPFCSTRKMDCSLYLTRQSSSFALHVFFSDIAMNETLTADYLDQHYWNAWATNPAAKMKSRSRTTVDGVPAAVHDLTWTEGDGTVWYTRAIYVSQNKHYYQIEVYANSQEVLDRYTPDIEKLLKGVDLTTGANL